MNQRKFFINQQSVKHCLKQKSQKFDHHSVFQTMDTLFFMDGRDDKFWKEVKYNLSSKQTKKWLNFTILFFNVNISIIFLVQHDHSFFKFFFCSCCGHFFDHSRNLLKPLDKDQYHIAQYSFLKEKIYCTQIFKIISKIIIIILV